MAKKKRSKKAGGKAGAKAPTKGEVYSTLAQATELTRRQVASVFEGLACMVEKNLGTRGPGVFTIPGLCKMTVRKKAATKARRGISPFTGEPTIFKARPASKVVRIRALKNLKEMVS